MVVARSAARSVVVSSWPFELEFILILPLKKAEYLSAKIGYEISNGSFSARAGITGRTKAGLNHKFQYIFSFKSFIATKYERKWVSKKKGRKCWTFKLQSLKR